jgi:hypothetical protein
MGRADRGDTAAAAIRAVMANPPKIFAEKLPMLIREFSCSFFR